MAAADAGSRSSVPLYICSVAEGEFLERHVVLLAIQFINLIRWLEMRLEASTFFSFYPVRQGKSYIRLLLHSELPDLFNPTLLIQTCEFPMLDEL
jgi:hypothetical protein